MLKIVNLENIHKKESTINDTVSTYDTKNDVGVKRTAQTTFICVLYFETKTIFQKK